MLKHEFERMTKHTIRTITEISHYYLLVHIINYLSIETLNRYQ